MFGNDSTLPLWVVVLACGILLNFVLGLVNPFVPKGYREKAKAFRKGGFRGGAPLVMVSGRFNGTIYVAVAALVNFVFSILFFIESYKNISVSVGGGFWGFCLVILAYLIVLFLGSAFMLAVTVFGEIKGAKRIINFYRKRYCIMVIFNEKDFESWIYWGDWPRSSDWKETRPPYDE